MKQLFAKVGATGRRFGRDTSGLALLEFAFSLPVVLLMTLTGAELTNYITTKMRVSQIALHLADNSARIGTGSLLQAKTISESDINDLLAGADMQAGELGLFTNGRVIISSIEPDVAPNETKSRIRWQRCKGAKTSLTSEVDDNGTTNQTGFGPTGRQVAAPANGVTMYVEVRYQYTPLIKTSLAPTSEIKETASMMVRDRRDTSSGTGRPDGVYPVTGVTASTC